MRATPPTRPSTTVLLCRDCCCGTAAKHPRTPHDDQQERLELAAQQHPDVEVRVVDCLDECDRSNVVVVRRAGRRTAERDTWLGGVLSDAATDALTAWVADGAVEPLPPRLAGHRFRHLPPRRDHVAKDRR